MAFCGRCGNPVEEGAVCGCSVSAKPRIDTVKAKGFFESLKNRMGIGDPERNATDTYERDMPIVQDCIRSCENEIPVKQYKIAVLRNLLRLERSEGRLQVTNKRVVFRAAGRSIGGRTTIQQEFAIDELSGIEAQRNYRFGFIYLVFGFVIFSLVLSLFAGIFGSVDYFFAQRRVDSIRSQIQRAEERYFNDVEQIERRHGDNPERMLDELNRLSERYQNNRERLQNRLMNAYSSFGVFGVVKYIIGAAGLFAFFWFHRKWLLKLAILGVSYAAFMSPIRASFGMFDSPWAMLGGFNIFTLITTLVLIIGLALYSLKPNLVLLFKTRVGLESAVPIKIQRSRGFWMWQQDGGTGFSEVFPTDESESAIREVNAMISDIQKMGDFGVQKWLNK